MSQQPGQPDFTNPSTNSPEEEEIQDYFVHGFDPDDVVPLWNLRQRFPLLNAFTTLFRGEPTGVTVQRRDRAGRYKAFRKERKGHAHGMANP